MYLVNVGHVNDGIQVVHFYVGEGFLESFPGCGLKCGFRIFHKAGGQGPVTIPGLNGTTAEQNLTVQNGHRTGDDSRILVMYGFATDAYVAVTIVPLWNFLFDLFAAGTAVFHSNHRKWESVLL
jgi:hypothetical protein